MSAYDGVDTDIDVDVEGEEEEVGAGLGHGLGLGLGLAHPHDALAGLHAAHGDRGICTEICRGICRGLTRGIGTGLRLDNVVESSPYAYIDPAMLDPAHPATPPPIPFSFPSPFGSPSRSPSINSTAADIDPASASLIRRMLAEEAAIFGSSSLSQSLDPAKRPNPKQKQKQKSKPKPAPTPAASPPSAHPVSTISKKSDLPTTHNTRWTNDENRLLIMGIAKYGYGRWKQVSDFLDSRNSRQVKNHVRDLVRKGEIKPPLSSGLGAAQKSVHLSTPMPLAAHYKNKVEEQIDWAGVHHKAATFPFNVGGSNLESKRATTEESVSLAFHSSQLPVVEVEHISVNDRIEIGWEGADAIAPLPTVIVNGVSIPGLTLSDIPVPTPKPAKPPILPLVPPIIEIDLKGVHPTEILHNPEWFHPSHQVKNAGKVPSRYMEIRNYILSLWDSSRPNFVTKTACRRGLKGKGDVHAISRVHQFLDWIGAINVGCEKQADKDYFRDLKEDNMEIDWEAVGPFLKMGKRRRRILGFNGEWVGDDEALTQGQDKERDSFSDPEYPLKKRKVTEVLQDSSENPFRLIMPTSTPTPPFKLNLHTHATVTMDFHSHMSFSEVMGLLGGRVVPANSLFNPTPFSVIEIITALPVKSISTGIQCEMCPLSQLEVRERFKSMALDCVGWYHSHPTFAPFPSARDCETQLMYQRMAPPIGHPNNISHGAFVGLIFSAWDSTWQGWKSRLGSIHVAEEPFSTQPQVFKPLSIPYTLIPSPTLPYRTLLDLKKNYVCDTHKVDLDQPWSRNVDRRTKFLRSLEGWNCGRPLGRIEEIVMELIGSETPDVKSFYTNV